MENIKNIREQCKAIKKEKKFTNQFLHEQTKVSRATIDRFFSNQECGFQYETIQPLVKFLIDFNKPVEETNIPIPDTDLMELYKSIIKEKESIIREKDNMIDTKSRSIEHLKEEAKDIKRSRNLFRTAFIVSIAVMLLFVYLFVDAMIGTIGMIRY